MSRFASLQHRFDAMQPRERMLISVTLGVLVVLGLYVLWIEPASKAAASNATQIESLAPQVESARAALALVQEELARDPEAERRLALDRLKQESGELDARLRADEAAVIPPGRMPAVLRDLLGRDARLTVLGVRSLPPEVLRWSPAPAPAPPPGSAPPAPTAEATVPSTEGIPALYRHRVVLRFEGDYAAALDYVRAVEALPFRVRLHDLNVDAERWPALTITLTVETLGLQEGWIGV
ncbi:type II secretion system protein GspM [Silanimonas sp.]|uniref:type II secretion system protein GspM n=1 Tax=Silanimonas sp. TaxID=1929290 RepID=UPI0022C98493|nr:type II secretion system protein GspM [Silanimonas sp.]MCZ8113883.1 type II secretion system protein GspM [Silanimonas sp.]